MNAHAYATSQLWALDSATLEVILALAAREDVVAPLLVAAKKGERLEGARRATVRDDAPGVAVIPVRGVVMRYGNLFGDLCDAGATSTEVLARDIRAAADDPAVRSILLEIDSPGGQAPGIAELAGMIRDVTARKPVVAYVGGAGASAAYWIAAAADEIVCAETALLGSIGAVLAVDARKTKGVLEFVSSVSPKKRPDLATDEGRAEIQARVDALGTVFVEHVARYRGVDAETVLKDFGRGGVLMGRSAVEAGLADRLGTFEGLLSEMAGGTVPRRAGITQAAVPGATSPAESSPMFSLFKKKNGALAIQTAAVDEGDEIATTLPIAAAPAPAPAAAETPAPEASDKDREIERLRGIVAASQLSTIETKAGAWYDALFAADKIVPAERDAAVGAYVQAALDDATSPVKAGKPRVEMLDGLYQARTPHTLTRERIDADAAAPAEAPKPGAKALPARDGEPDAPVSEARINQLLGHLVEAGLASPEILAKK